METMAKLKKLSLLYLLFSFRKEKANFVIKILHFTEVPLYITSFIFLFCQVDED